MAQDDPQAVASIEVTPQMIKAGRIAFANWDDRFETPSELVLSVYWAMVGAKNQALEAQQRG